MQVSELFKQSNTILLDGGMGTMLQAAGLKLGARPEELNITDPQLIEGIHAQYAAAGSRIINANTFGASAHKPAAAALTKSNIYAAILAASQTLDDAEVPETERALVVTPATYAILKQAVEFDHTEIGAEMRARGVVAMLDGAAVVKVPSARLPEKFGFMLAHPSATVAPVKLEDFGIHNDTPLSSGSIVTGRICYDAFVLDNKKTGIYYQATT